MPSTITSALLYHYLTRYGTTAEGAVLAHDPFCNVNSTVRLARMHLITDDGIGGEHAIAALGWILDVQAVCPSPEQEEIFTCLISGKYATAVNLAEKAGILK